MARQIKFEGRKQFLEQEIQETSRISAVEAQAYTCFELSGLGIYIMLTFLFILYQSLFKYIKVPEKVF